MLDSGPTSVRIPNMNTPTIRRTPPFQRLRKGLDLLHRYSGITEVSIREGFEHLIIISLPPTLKLDRSTIKALTELDWTVEDTHVSFQP